MTNSLSAATSDSTLLTVAVTPRDLDTILCAAYLESASERNYRRCDAIKDALERSRMMASGEGFLMIRLPSENDDERKCKEDDKTNSSTPRGT